MNDDAKLLDIMDATPEYSPPHDAKSKGPQIVTAASLGETTFPDLRVIVDGILTEGLFMVCGRPKRGKSWLLFLLAVMVALGRSLWGKYATSGGDVLLLCLEDSPRRVNSRLDIIGLGKPATLHFAFQWKRLNDGGLADLDKWCSEHQGALVVIDTIGRIKPPTPRGEDAYEHGVAIGAALQAIALRHHVCIVCVHHTRKSQADNIFDTILGESGLPAAADGLIVLTRKGRKGELHVTGRDIAELRLKLGFEGGLWSYIGELDDEDDDDDPIERAQDFLTEFLTPGAMESERIFEEGEARGIKRATLYNAKKRMNIKAKPGGFRGGWTWMLPEGFCKAQNP
ncbi:MAG: helicase RepA family protein [bacterium]|nr:helicase RepA family protein [bacterium]